ncbi:MAG TPA: SDR family oxidoreductase [Blastocatellia bacterium]|nr:SDR family oxidoreductase [Blastocatellia bacterium]
MGARLHGKVAIVTGGAQGIGRATAELFAAEGASVVVADLDEREARETVGAISAKGGEAVFVRTDVSHEADAQAACEEALRTFGRLDVLVNNAAAFVLKGLEASVEDWQKSLGVNVIGSALMSRYAAEAMKKGKGGAIVNLGSISSFVAQPSFVTYSATKAALLQMTRNMALDLAPFGIRVNCVCPGTILTRATQDHMERVGMTLEEFKAAEGPKNLLNRIGEPHEVAHAILFLASDEASYITGAHLLVDGGYTTL